MSSVLVKQVTLVKPEGEAADREITHTLLPAYSHRLAEVPYQDRYLFFRKPGTDLSQMKRSLEATLSHFYPLGGRISVRPDNRMELYCNDEGVKFIEASCDLSLPQEDEFDLEPTLLQQLCQAQGNEHNLKYPWPSDAPLLFIQVTVFRCKGFCIGLKYSHQLLDGASFWHFVTAWAEISCKKPISKLPIHMPYPIQMPPESAAPPPLPPSLARIPRQQLNHVFLSNALDTKRFRFRKSFLQELKQQYPAFSRFQLLSAYIWRKVTQARGLKEDELTSLYLAMNCRKRVSCLLSEAHFGGATYLVHSTIDAGRLLCMTLEQAASLVKQSILAFREEDWHSYCQAIAHYANDPELKLVIKRTANDIIIGSSFNFAAYQEFAWGIPFEIAMFQPQTDGCLFYFPGRQEGDVDVYLCLRREALQKLADDPTFQLAPLTPSRR